MSVQIAFKPTLHACQLLIYHFIIQALKHSQMNYNSLVFGVTETLLQRAFLQCIEKQRDLCWTLNDKPVTIGFYRELHKYLRKWPPSRSATKTTVGRFYL